MKKQVILILSLVLFAAASAQNNLKNALNAYDAGKYKDALAYVNRVLDKENNNIEAYRLRCLIYFDNQMYGNALSDANNALKYYTTEYADTPVSLYQKRGEIYFYLDEYSKAADDYSTVIKFEPKNTDNLCIRGMLYSKLGKYEPAYEDFKKAIEIDETNINAMKSLARVNNKIGIPDSSFVLLEKAIKQYPGDADLYMLMSDSYSLTDNKRLAIDYAITAYEYNSEYIEQLASKLDKLPSYAIGKLTEKINNTQDYMWHILRGSVYMSLYKYDKSLDDYKSILRIAPELEDGMVNLFGLSYTGQGKYDKAIKLYTKGIKNEPSNDSFYRERGQTYHYKGDFDNAIKDLTKAIELNPDSADTEYFIRGTIYEKQNNTDAAIKDYTKSIEIKSGLQAYLHRGYIYYKTGKKDAAIKDFEYILKTDTVPDANSFRQFALVYLGKPDEAREWEENIMKSETKDMALYYNAACLCAILGEKDKAINYLTKAVESGFRHFIYLDMDTDLASIRETEEYKTLIGPHIKRSKK